MSNHLGTKRHCPECQGKFYDMGALEVRCPKCEFVFPIHLTSREEPLAQPKVAAKPKTKKAVPKDKDTIEEMGEVVELDDLDDLDDFYDDVGHLEEVEDHHEDPENDINSDDADDDMFIDEIGDDDVHIVDDLDNDDEYEEREAL